MVEVNKRVATRRRVLKGAKIVSMDMQTVVDCTIRDISETGAKLNVQHQMGIPERFQFFQISENTLRPATVVWRTEKQLGVNFTGPPTPAPANLQVT